MCDTFVAVSEATADGSVILGKNSDREPNEAQPLVHVPATVHDSGTDVRATYISLPQASSTRGVLLSKPYWIWGAEMGVNDAGVAIGNEAVFTKAKREPQPGLLGMDLLRLALERAGDAEEAVSVITELLATYGQAGKAGHTANLQYDNSFLVADASQAFVLETVGRDWAIAHVAGTRSISNGLTLRGNFDSASPGLRDARDIAKQHSDFVYTHFSDSSSRQCRTTDVLSAASGRIDVSDAMALLRDHGAHGDSKDWSPDSGLFGQTVCAHAAYGPVRVAQSTGAMVAHLTEGGATVWLTGTSATCLSTFKPVWLDSGLPDLGNQPGRYFDESSLWWRHELLHREVLADYATRAPIVRASIAEYEGGLRSRAAQFTAEVGDETRDARARLTASAFDAAALTEAEALANIRRQPIVHRGSWLYRRAWAGFDRDARMREAS